MRIAHIHDPLIGVVEDVYLSDAQDKTWQRARRAALKSICDSAATHQADALLLTGRLFGEGYVTNAVVTEIVDILRQCSCPVVWAPDAAGLAYLAHRDDLPEKLTLLCESQTSCTIRDVCLLRWTGDNGAVGGCQVLLADTEEAIDDGLHRSLSKAVPSLSYIVAGGAVYSRKRFAYSCV